VEAVRYLDVGGASGLVPVPASSERGKSIRESEVLGTSTIPVNKVLRKFTIHFYFFFYLCVSEASTGCVSPVTVSSS